MSISIQKRHISIQTCPKRPKIAKNGILHIKAGWKMTKTKIQILFASYIMISALMNTVIHFFLFFRLVSLNTGAIENCSPLWERWKIKIGILEFWQQIWIALEKLKTCFHYNFAIFWCLHNQKYKKTSKMTLNWTYPTLFAFFIRKI